MTWLLEQNYNLLLAVLNTLCKVIGGQSTLGAVNYLGMSFYLVQKVHVFNYYP